MQLLLQGNSWIWQMHTHAHTHGINTDVDASTLTGKHASRCTRRGFMTSVGVLKIFLSLCYVLNFLLAPFTNLPPAHNRIISCVSMSLLAYLYLFPLAFLLCLSASCFSCVSLSLSLLLPLSSRLLACLEWTAASIVEWQGVMTAGYC